MDACLRTAWDPASAIDFRVQLPHNNAVTLTQPCIITHTCPLMYWYVHISEVIVLLLFWISDGHISEKSPTAVSWWSLADTNIPVLSYPLPKNIYLAVRWFQVAAGYRSHGLSCWWYSHINQTSLHRVSARNRPRSFSHPTYMPTTLLGRA
jgi:hypothetical protein